MTNERLYEVLGNINEQYVKEAEEYRKAKKPAWLKWMAAAACLCLAAGLAVLPMVLHPPAEAPGDAIHDADRPPSLTVHGTDYCISPHMAVSNELPDGFLYAGEASVGGFDDCPYYTNPDKPEWVYVYQQVWTDGTVDETGTLNRTEPHHAYVRYVDVRLRGKKLVCCSGAYYISMWGAVCFGDRPDVTQEYYDEMAARYGIRIEGAVPDGFEFAGTAAFSGDDTIPTGELASNQAAADVYYDPADPAVILVETFWYTATAKEHGQTRHDGFDVYIRYDCPFLPKG
jgi:hypothetical protein